MPEQEQQQRDHGGFEQPDDHRTRAGERAAIAPHVPEQQSAGGDHAQRQNPHRPGRQQNELPLLENRAGIFEQKLEHDGLGILMRL